MTLVSLSAFAKMHGASRQAAAKWKSKGALVFSGDLIDVVASDQRMRDAGLGRFKTDAAEVQPTPATTPRNRQPVAGSVAGGNRRKVAPAVTAVVDEVVADFQGAIEDEAIDEEIAGGFIEQLLAGQFRTKVEAAGIKENALALKHLLVAQKEAGKLVDIETAEAALFNDRRAARDAWMAWPGRFAPLLAADLDIDGAKLAEALKPYVHQQLDELGEPDLDWSGADEG